MESHHLQPSPRHLEPERGQLGRRRGHVPQISISDDSHHVTEAIGDMYGDYSYESSRNPSSPPAADDSNYSSSSNYFDTRPSGSQSYSHPPDLYIQKSSPTEKNPASANGSPTESRQRQTSLSNSPGAGSAGSSSPPILHRTNSTDTANQAFPLNDIDYESSPAAVAQELSNLQAIRRMSMNVDAADPDLPTFGGPPFSVPSAAPSHSSDEDDASRMFWVPARLHPELAPKEFKTFIDDRVERIRRSREESSLFPESNERRRSSGSLSRRKSMLSKTIDSAVGWEDGADILERKRSQSSQSALDSETTLQDLEQLVGDDPSELVRKMSLDSSRHSLEGAPEGSPEDMPILPAAPGGQSLKRSTRTNYRRGSLRKGERVPMSRRVAQRILDGDTDEPSPPSPTSSTGGLSEESTPRNSLQRVQTEPISGQEPSPGNFSRPSRRGRSSAQAPASSSAATFEDILSSTDQSSQTQDPTIQTPRSPPKPFQSRIASNGRTTAPLPGYNPPPSVPQIVETPPAQSHETWQATQPPPFNHVQNLPERKSSHEYSRQASMYNRSQEQRQPIRPRTQQNQTLDDMANNPSLMPGTSTRTDALSFIPTFNNIAPEEKKPDRKSKDKRESGESSSSRKSSWGWLLGSQNQDSDKDKKDKEDKESSRKSKSKSKQVSEKPHDSARLDVLQSAVEGQKGRESFVLDRESVKLEEERKKDSSRKSSEPKKERETGLFSSLFGGKKKGDRDSAASKKADKDLRLSPEPPLRALRADIDYNWTRFSILEERAIYRMAHIKLANPRRALYSQVLLSNFMYSYLAKVQQMHPQIQIPQHVLQSQGQKGAAVEQQTDPEPDEYSQWQLYQEQHEHMSASSDGTSFVEDYGPEHQQHEDSRAHNQKQYLNNVNINGNGLGVYSSQQGQWSHNDMYSDQGLFDDRPEADDVLW